MNAKKWSIIGETPSLGSFPRRGGFVRSNRAEAGPGWNF